MGDIPYAGLKNDQVLQLVIEGQRMLQPANCPQAVYEVMRKCLGKVIEKRPSFSELKEALQSIVKDGDDVSKG